MQEFKPAEQTITTTRVLWPSPQDYNEAVQTPGTSFSDDELRAGQVETTPLGLPRSMSGNFASVFCFHCKERKVAVRCFLHNIPDQQARYHSISQYVMADDLPSTVPVEYIEKGILIHGDWYPILKMEWVEGETLCQFVEKHLDNSVAINLLASYFKDMTLDLRRHGIAHGDLQHDNIMISHDELRLVDYDGMYVPELSGQCANELGHRNYQHPQRSAQDFGPRLDNFSAWVIYTSLKALSRDPGLFHELDCGGDCLLFRRSDFEQPEQSKAFHILCDHPDEKVRQCADALLQFVKRPLCDVPCLDQTVEACKTVLIVSDEQSGPAPPPLPVQPRSGKANQSLRGSNLPDWLTDGENHARGAAAHTSSSHPAKPPRTVPAAVAKAMGQAMPSATQADPIYPQLSSIPSLWRDLLERDKFRDHLAATLPKGEQIMWVGELLGPADAQSGFKNNISAIWAFSFVMFFVLHQPWLLALIVVFLMFVTFGQPRVRLAAITGERLIVVTARGFKCDQNIRVMNIPLSEIDRASGAFPFSGNGAVSLYAKTMFKVGPRKSRFYLQFCGHQRVLNGLLTSLPATVSRVPHSKGSP